MTLRYDKKLDIALGSSRKTKVWKNKPVKWSELLDRLATTTRTTETVAEYKAMTRDQQSDRKDTGGFVGGYCNDGSRSNVRHRSILCLDADYADGEVWEDWKLLYGNAAAVYSTHKHTPEKPRMRLVIPLGRDVTPEEYPAVGRAVAAALGIDKFDDSTYEVGRLMYWPSTSQDGVFVFDKHDAPFLDPDAVLATYHNWRDVSSWPVSSRISGLAKRKATKQQDPLTKPGLVGAVCRAYTIQEAIEAFDLPYDPTDDPNRYSYRNGSTACGAVVYEDKFLHSFHGTDPASGKSCNVWDLVRLHKFGHLDEGLDPDTPASALPSYKEMAAFAAEDAIVKRQLLKDRQAEIDTDFEILQDEPSEEALSERLKYTKKGAIEQTIDNVVAVLTCDPNLAGTIGLNEMEHNIVAMSSLPWNPSTKTRQWSDADDSNLRYYMERKYDLKGKDRIFDAVNVVAQQRAFHPVREYLDGCEWDRVPRVETLLVDYLGAEDTEYTRAVTRKALVAAVSRIYRPGCKFDYMLTLRGKQGIGKSALIAKLGGKWFSDTFSTMQGKEAYEQVLGVWIMEIGELAGMRKAEAETIKLYISKQVDRFRPAYGRRTQEFPRQCIFVGTTNETQFLRDTTGNRRFWVVDTPNKARLSIWNDLTEETVRLIWGEAVAMYKAGEPLYLSKELEEQAREIQESFEEENPRVGIVSEYLDRLLPEDWEEKDLYARRQWLESGAIGTVRRDIVCTMEIWAEALGQNPDKYDRYGGKEIRDIMACISDWKFRGRNSNRIIRPYGRQRYYERREKQC